MVPKNPKTVRKMTMKTKSLLLALALLGAASAVQAAPNCSIKLKGDDRMQFDLKTATVSAGCATITIELTHTGSLPATAMGHNVVITATKDVAAVASAGIKAKATDYVPAGDARVLASTKIIGGGASTKATFPGKKLTAGGDYSFFCSFPGHSGLMKGKLKY